MSIEIDEATDRFKALWLYCMLDCGKGSLPYGPCRDCIDTYAISGPPDGRWNGG